MNEADTVSPAMPDQFDRLLGQLHGLPDVTITKPSTVRTVTPLVGSSALYIVQTFRHAEQGDTIFLECVLKSGTVRLVLPPKVATLIARQRDALSGKSRSRAAKAVAQARKERGELPGFLKKKSQ
jgi:hypothetical protein